MLFQVAVETWGLGGQRVRDFSLYCGTLGTALLQFKAYQLTNNIDDLNLCSEIIKACDTVCSRSRFSHSRFVRSLSVLCGYYVINIIGISFYVLLAYRLRILLAFLFMLGMGHFYAGEPVFVPLVLLQQSSWVMISC